MNPKKIQRIWVWRISLRRLIPVGQIGVFFLLSNPMNFCFLVLARVRVTLTDTVIRLEHMIDKTDHGVALEIRIKK